MNSSRFDVPFRRLTNLLPRRQILGAVAVMLTAELALTEHALACKKVGKKCDKNKDCCDGARCKGDTKDKKGKCRCKSGLTECSGRCENLDNDTANCGACGVRCDPGDPCLGGFCADK